MPPKKKSAKKTESVTSDTIESELSSDSELSEQSIEDKEDNQEFDSDDEEPDNEEIEFDDGDNEELKALDKTEDKDAECFFKYVDENNDFDEDDINITDSNANLSAAVPEDERISINRMTKYEYVRLLGTRTKQLAMGAKPMIKNVQGLSSKDIALLELKNNTTPLIVKRPLPNKRYELWKVSELIKNHLYD
ncbi:hypothetical protein CPAV1605_209 [seawater metagenome]|uniref:RNA polymerase Rpb6 n=1 Tax=seawater metagenome TaxID=1561972 RepID=A0A5E8CHE7_9ZZZZ